MSYTIIVDSVACIPNSELKKRSIKVLPLKISLDGKHYLDRTSDKQLLPFYSNQIIKNARKAFSVTPTENDMVNYALKRVAPYYDQALVLTIAKEYSPIYYRCIDAAVRVSEEAEEGRRARGKESVFVLSCKDSGSVAAGQGLVALYADNLLRDGMSFASLTSSLDTFSSNVKSLTIISDSVFIRQQVKAKGNKTMSYPAALLSNAIGIAPIANNQNGEIDILARTSIGLQNSINRVFDYCIDRLEEGLHTPIINVSYSGNIVCLKRLQSYFRLKRACDDAGVKLLIGTMTLAAGVNLGTKAISVGIAPINQTATP